MLNAALLGVVDGRDCGEPQFGDGDTAPNTDRHTPHDLESALVALEADNVLCEAMGADLVNAFTTIRRDEVEKWRAADGVWDVKSISTWELEQYLRSSRRA
jgi:glutamine synthetase